jgi:hypothetical protein
MKNIYTIKSQIRDIEDRLQILQERSYYPELSTSEIKEITKRRKKLSKNKEKLLRKLEQFKFNPDYNDVD